MPFRQLGQYEDVETGLYYNRFRYYNPETGLYISQDPIKLAGNNPNFYAYTFDSNTMVDVFGLENCGKVHKDFKSGASFLMTGNAYNDFVKGQAKVGRPDGQFVAPTNQINDLLKKANGDISVIEKGLGIPSGGWQGKGGLYKIDIPKPLEHNLRLPTSDLSGANELFIPGGTTSGGIAEAVMDQVPISQVIITKIL
ncbi:MULTISPECIES: RHS repeat-associated core domain-containing protein [unclassified Gilliamella]|uniref:RHS repeat-associated core domain-containing protein n=1 Tax=Gilliamella sp. Lep-s35 TaxID=2687312 RepID=UPI00130CD184|nr:hypothetical protein [Gilliamella sp. Lep-s35]MWP70139.1 hypothetical protein [Gilliamella sp. Lep-s5]MWP78366.1 hypothetical protein [Gilliamella sp. Lep-s21]